MPHAPQSRDFSARKNVTCVIGRFHAELIDVCKKGDVIALHFSTKQGVVLITSSLHEFTVKCRGKRDHIGTPLPEIEPIVSLDFPAEPPAVKPGQGRTVPPEILAGYEAAARDFVAGVFLTKAAAARAHRVEYGPWLSWFDRHVVTERKPYTKPGGKIL